MQAARPRAAFRYPVIFRSDGETPTAGSLVIDGETVVVSGGAGERARELRVPLRDVEAVRTSRLPSERLNNYPVLVLERAEGTPLFVAPLGAGLLTELADLLVSLNLEARADRVVVVLPLRAGRIDRARQLVERGPPFAPDSLSGIRHSVYLDGSAVFFVFEGAGARSAVERLMRTPAVWRASLSWREAAAGPPHATTAVSVPPVAAELVYESPR